MTLQNPERIVFFNGQSLTAEDLIALETANRELRWLHNSTLHNWGIGVGLEVTGTRGDTVATIQPGYGVDSRGREIILTEVVRKPIPAVPAGAGGGEAIYYLTASYLDDSAQSAEERRDGVCMPGGTVRLSDEPSIDWRLASQLRTGLDLILGQAWILNCQLNRDISGAVRRYARACQLPYFHAGLASPGGSWQPWTEGGQTVGFTAAIDTSIAAFQASPRYAVQLVGSPFTLWNAQPVLALAFASVGQPAPSGFTLQLAIPDVGGSTFANPAVLRDPMTGPQILQQLGWQIAWLGIEG
jgi:hypothetical protein